MLDKDRVGCVHFKNESIGLVSSPCLKYLTLFLVYHRANLQHPLVKCLQISHQNLLFVNKGFYFVLVRGNLQAKGFKNFILHFKLNVKDFLVAFFVGNAEHLFSVGLDFANCLFERTQLRLDIIGLFLDADLCLLHTAQVLEHLLIVQV